MTRLVVALGHPDRGDDAIGGLVAARLRAEPPPDCVITSVVNPLDLLDAWTGFEAVIVVDAIDAGVRPGAVSVVQEDALERLASASGTHDLGLGQVVSMAASLGRRPQRLAVVGVQGAAFGVGQAPSPEALAAVPEAAGVVRELLGRPHRSAGGFGP